MNGNSGEPKKKGNLGEERNRNLGEEKNGNLGERKNGQGGGGEIKKEEANEEKWVEKGKNGGRSLLSERRWIGNVNKILHGSGEREDVHSHRQKFYRKKDDALPLPLPLPSSADVAVSGWWVDRIRLLPDWIVTEDYKGVPGVFVLEHRASLACFVVLRDTCHFNFEWEPGFRGGNWYSSRGYNLSKIVNQDDVCNQAKKLNPEDKGLYAQTDRAQYKQGNFRSHEKVEKIISEYQNDNSISPDQKWDSSVIKLKRAMASPHDGFVGHFCEVIGTLTDVAYSLSNALEISSGSQIFDDLFFHFGADFKEKKFSMKVVKILFGDNVKWIPGKHRKGMAHVCFEEVIFPISREYKAGPAIEWFRNRAYASVNEFISGVRKPMKTIPHYQLTWLVRNGRRNIINKGRVLEILASTFRLPVHFVEFSDDVPFEEVVDTMRRTAFGFGMHGGALSNEIFMPGGSHFLEILPFKFDYRTYQQNAERCGVHHHQLSNTHFENSSYSNNCFQSEWLPITELECRKIKACFSCVKDHPSTIIHTGELEEKLRPLVPLVKSWIEEQKTKAGDDVTSSSTFDTSIFNLGQN